MKLDVDRYGLPFVMTAVLVPLSAYIAWTQYRAELLSRATEASTCTITETKSGVVDDGHYVELRFRHHVGQLAYEGSDGRDGLGSSEAAGVALSHREGTEVPCKYVAGRPDLVRIFERSADPWMLLLVVLGLVTSAALWAHALRRRRE